MEEALEQWNACVCNGTCYARKKWAGSAEGSAWQGLGTWLRHSGNFVGVRCCAGHAGMTSSQLPGIMVAAAAAASHGSGSMAVWVHSGLPCAAGGAVGGTVVGSVLGGRRAHQLAQLLQSKKHGAAEQVDAKQQFESGCLRQQTGCRRQRGERASTTSSRLCTPSCSKCCTRPNQQDHGFTCSMSPGAGSCMDGKWTEGRQREGGVKGRHAHTHGA